jgi:two-component SAPR family response regulator
MNKKGPIILIENNQGDRKLFTQIFSELGFSNNIQYFHSGNDAYNYLTSNNVKPFLIFSDIVLLHMDDDQEVNISFKNLSLELNCPCLFFTTVFNQCFVMDLYALPTQNYIVKPYSYEKFKEIINTILEYWHKNEFSKQIKIKKEKDKL